MNYQTEQAIQALPWAIFGAAVTAAVIISVGIFIGSVMLASAIRSRKNKSV